ncbi:P-type ATPase [Elasticomyces elasticus]|nr:P-type ATPase [Elasticomyces elasticus]
MAESKAAVLLGSGNKPLSKPAHALTFAAVLEELQTNDDTGITAADAKERLSTYGGNELGDGAGVQPAKILLRQIANAMTLVLIIAMAVSFGIGSYIEGGVISAVVVLNVVVGFWQEFKAAKTMDSLKSLSSPTASAVRASENITVPTVEIVPGDIVELKTGDTVPADLRLLETVNFETDEALLTGESLPVRKDPALVLDDATGPGDRLNVAYSSSTVTKGRARGVVFATGLDTEIGTIAAALRATGSKVRTVKRNDEGQAGPHRYAQAWGLTATDAVGHFLGVNVGTPLQRKLSRLAVLLFCVAVVCAIIVLAANDFSSEQEVIIYAVATGLSTLTQGKMITKKAYIPASGTFSVEDAKEPFNPTNGHVTFIANDHTDAEKAPTGTDFTSFDTSLARDDAHLGAFLDVAALANTSVVSPGQQEGEWHARGDPTEIAINVFACRFDWTKSRLVGGDHPLWKTKLEFPFDSDVKKMSVIVENTHTEEKHVLTKGAVERVLDSCADYHATRNDSMNATKMTGQQRQRILGKVEEFASQGLRVLAFASRIAPPDLNYEADIDRNSVECELTFRGLIGLYDPPRAESASSVAACRRAGIEVHMLTGDHPGTARAIAIEVGILPSLAQLKGLAKDVADALVMTASGFDKLSDAEVDELPQLPLVVARCAPNTKVRMIEALHRRNKFTAMVRSRRTLERFKY